MSERNNSVDIMPLVVIAGVAVIVVCLVLVLLLGATLILGMRFSANSGMISTAAVEATVVPLPTFTPTSEDPAEERPEGEQSQPDPDEPTPTPEATAPPGPAQTLAMLDAVEIPPRDRLDLAQRLLGVQADPILEPRDWQIGDTDTFFVSDFSGTTEVLGELVYISGDVYAWVEQGQDYDAAALQEELDLFALEIVPNLLETYGGDTYPRPGQETQFHIFHNTAMSPGVAGYYSSSSEWPLEAVEFSNERSMFMINLSNTEPGGFGYIDVLTHEFQHLIHWHVDLNEESWLNEGLSELAPYLNGLGASGFTTAFLDNPEIQLTDWPEDSSTLPHYGGGYLFAAYFLEQFGVEAVQALVAEPLNGMEGVQAALETVGSTLTAEEVFANFVVANYINDVGVAPEYGYQTIEAEYGSINLRTPDLQASYATRDYPVTVSDFPIRQYSTQYIALDGPATLTIEFDGSDLLAVLPTDTRNTDGDPATDDSVVWWSNRGDDSNTTLTRAFDLTDAANPVLEYDLWFLIEDRWDYGYVEVSTDDGETWDVLETPYTTTDNPFGNAYGPGYTGSSAGFPAADSNGWVSEALDLGAYAGQEVLVRFELVTDDAVNRPGFAVDNIRIEAIDFYDDGEAGENGWQAAGFVQMDNIIPQSFIVQVISEANDGTITVEELPLDAANRGQVTVEVGRSPTVLAISPIGRHTTNAATYTLTVTEAD